MAQNPFDELATLMKLIAELTSVLILISVKNTKLDETIQAIIEAYERAGIDLDLDTEFNV